MDNVSTIQVIFFRALSDCDALISGMESERIRC